MSHFEDEYGKGGKGKGGGKGRNSDRGTHADLVAKAVARQQSGSGLNALNAGTMLNDADPREMRR